MQVKITNTSDNLTPEYKSKSAAGFDIAAFILNENKKVVIEPSEQKLIATGLFMEIPDGYYLQLKSRSGLAKERNLHVTAGVIDSDYRGQIHVLLINHSKEKQVIKSGDRIAQGIIIPYVQAEFHTVAKLSETMRGDGGFGSTGIGSEQSKAIVQSVVTETGVDLSMLAVGDRAELRDGDILEVERLDDRGVLKNYRYYVKFSTKGLMYQRNGRYIGDDLVDESSSDIVAIHKA